MYMQKVAHSVQSGIQENDENDAERIQEC